MNCVYCNREMKKGKMTFTDFKGFPQFIGSFVGEEEENKGFFRRKTHEAFIIPGVEAKAYYCENCKKIVTVFKEGL